MQLYELTDVDDNVSQVSDLFKNNTKRPLDGIEKKVDTRFLPSSGLSKSAATRLKIEFRFMKFISFLIGDEKHTEAMFLIEQYYTKQQCKKGIRSASGAGDTATEYSALPKGPCNNEGWCVKCLSLIHI